METKQFDELQANPKNPRRISKHDFEALKNSIKEFGDLSGIVFNVRTRQLVGGHQRVEAFKALGGHKQVVIEHRFEAPNRQGTIGIGHVELDGEMYKYREVDWSKERELAANVAANRIQGEFDKDLLAEVIYDISQAEDGDALLALTGNTNKQIDELLDASGASGEAIAEDEAPEVDTSTPPVSRLGEIYQLGPHRLMCGDSTDFGALSDLMDGAQADMIFTDPPYNVAYEGKTKDALTIKNDSMSDEQFYQFLLAVHKNLAEVTKPGGALYVCHADSEGLNFRRAFAEGGFLLKQCLVWVKQAMVMGRQDYQWQHEPILYGWRDGGSHYFVDDRTQTTVWEIDRPSKSTDHPTMKPLALCAKAIKNSSPRGALVLDVFGGSGSTLIAAQETGRTCYMMELDPRYVDVIRKRYAAKVGQGDWVAATPIVPGTEQVAPEAPVAPVPTGNPGELTDIPPA